MSPGTNQVRTVRPDKASRIMTPAVKPQTSGNTLTLSTNTLMLIVGGALLYFAGKKGR